MAAQSNSSLQCLIEALHIKCFYTKSGLYILPSFAAAWTLFLFPLYSLVLHTGFQRWQQNQRASVSHTDFFTYHTLVFELLFYCGAVVMSCAAFQTDFHLTMHGGYTLAFASLGVLLLHVLTCVERYLAVVYPVVYLSLRKQRWLWVRHGIIVAIWLLCLVWMWTLKVVPYLDRSIPIMAVLAVMASIVLFCNVQVLYTLRNPSPGEGRGVSHSKQKAFFTVSAILSVLVLRLSCGIIFYGIEKADLELDVICRLQKSECWCELPSSLVLPLLFLQRAGKLPRCRRNKVENRN